MLDLVEHASYFESDAHLRVGNRDLVLTLAEQNALVGSGSYWHGPGDPSTWLAERVLSRVRNKYPDVPDSTLVDLAALALGVERRKLIDLIRWHENYMRWHDGGEYAVLDESVTE